MHLEFIMQAILANFPLVLLIIALICAAFRWTGQALCRWILLLPVGVGGLWGFAFHAFMPEYAAQYIGWEPSPFQYEVAAANFGLGVIGIAGFWKSWDFALAATLMADSFLWGAALVHLIELLIERNYAPGNAGTILHTDILVPLLLSMGLCMWKQEIRIKKF